MFPMLFEQIVGLWTGRLGWIPDKGNDFCLQVWVNLPLYVPYRHTVGAAIQGPSFLSSKLEESVQPHAPAPLKPGKEPPAPTKLPSTPHKNMAAFMTGIEISIKF